MSIIADSVKFHGKLSELYELAKKGKIETNLQGSHTRPCKFWTATKILSGIKNSIIITHGPSGCAYGVKQAYKLTNCRNSGQTYEPVISTNIGEKNVIYGGAKELWGAIKEVDKKYSPEVIFVATSCATGIIGDNVDSIIEKMESEVNARLMSIHCEGFSGEYRSGFDLVFKQIVNLMDEPTEQSRAEMSHMVNIVGGKMGAERTEVDTDVKELIRLIKGMGAEVNSVIAGNCTLSEIKRAPSVAVNCALCLDIGYAIGKSMEEKFGTPINSTILPYGIAATERWIRGAAKYLNMEKEAEDLIEKEYMFIKKEFEESKKYLKGKIGIVEGHDAVKSLSIAHMLKCDFEMRPIIFNFHPWSTEARRTSIDYLLETGIDPEILITKGTLAFGKYESMRQTEDELLLFLGDMDIKSLVYFGSSLSFPNIPVIDLNAILNRPRFGYRGALKVAKCINTALQYSFRPRSFLYKTMVFPKNCGLSSAKSLTPKLSQDLPDCTVYAHGRRGQCMMK
ncbi:nitrogenase component 1 [Clostridium luticellarii]|jgi:nitrogenase molybdenum-cofactor synthesis protein NifE|uniref:Nitrogenase molybdenum-iron protein alpha chain n=1 Tax=Clostridium luticellarii TaxID=1691940 RepID=A0A2T0BA54_9CLOT|nr:nitrogenase component 1 [Clostridium luticellarii]MCI1945702.1 nitrogenase associated protein E [Clostridium luticellarii]MCI1969061.1 nitrogenase associated protein E [Clostridium luticellarii]MCI1996073.1 nitrogenase associated protein E [Clostridium luticellarii]MCI2040440.1 nitrogenase associated protein E [Clostridium luticellarii]PRR80769.1 Nitrogenase molybdenum-iron protein alpha chain [Clostridium luticellarii]